jgi:hypothetical protein
LCAEKAFIGRADGVERPERAQLHDGVAIFLEQLAQLRLRVLEFTTGFRPRAEFEPRLTGEPFVPVRVQFHQFG